MHHKVGLKKDRNLPVAFWVSPLVGLGVVVGTVVSEIARGQSLEFPGALPALAVRFLGGSLSALIISHIFKPKFSSRREERTWEQMLEDD
jgi:hypothetical protein